MLIESRSISTRGGGGAADAAEAINAAEAERAIRTTGDRHAEAEQQPEATAPVQGGETIAGAGRTLFGALRVRRHRRKRRGRNRSRRRAEKRKRAEVAFDVTVVTAAVATAAARVVIGATAPATGRRSGGVKRGEYIRLVHEGTGWSKVAKLAAATVEKTLVPPLHCLLPQALVVTRSHKSSGEGGHGGDGMQHPSRRGAYHHRFAAAILRRPSLPPLLLHHDNFAKVVVGPGETAAAVTACTTTTGGGSGCVDGGVLPATEVHRRGNPAAPPAIVAEIEEVGVEMAM